MRFLKWTPRDQWHRWYAWRPVYVYDEALRQGEYVWFETIERRFLYGCYDTFTEYRHAQT
jgi:hypothetical protein